MKMGTIAGLFALALLVTGCGGDHADHAMTPSGGDGLSSAGEPGEPADADRTVEIRATESLKFDPPSLEVAIGDTITFVVTNDTSTPHEFVLGDKAYQDSHGAAMANGMHHEGNAVTLDPGDTEELTWTFTDAGEVIYACHVAGHYASGMKGTISVE